MTYRVLSPDEIVRLGQEYEIYHRWEAVRAFAAALYGPLAYQVTISVMSEYNDSSYDERASIVVTDATGNALPYDFSLPWWQRFCISDEQIAEYLEKDHSGSLTSTRCLGDGDEVYEALRTWCAEDLEIDFSEHWRPHDPIAFTYLLGTPPLISHPLVYVAE
jgi:hypothetical protein